jgi:hypothetical protein
MIPRKPGAKAPKYRNEPIAIGGEKYRSKREMRRHQALLLLERAGQIAELRREVPYVLAEKVKIQGEDRARPAIRYVADFTYVDRRTGLQVVEDAKGVQTDVYRLKKHLMATVHGIHVQEA